MTHCINCGTPNEADAAFCLSCGQPLYRGSTGAALVARSKRLRQRLTVIISLVVLIAGVVALFALRPSSDERKTADSANESPKVTPKITDEAVLTIAGTNRSNTGGTQGSGFILTGDGLAVTNYHVLKGISQAIAECCGGRVFEIRSVEGSDLNKDLIVFQLYDKGSTSKPQGLPHVTLGSSRESKVGDRVIVIGSPQGLENTMSDGILSAVREYEATRLLQITAPISPGSSGGPVFNAAGEVIGIASFQFAKGQNLNFAIAAEHVQPLLEQHFSVALSQFESFDKHGTRVHSDATASETTKIPRETGKNVARSLTGQFAGVVHNVTSKVSAEFGIIVNESDGVLSGCMGVRQPLFGSGALTGVVNDSNVFFVVTSAIGEINFEGQRSGSSLNGTYTVTHDAAPTEEGTFTLRKSKSQSLPSGFDTATCPTDAEMNQ